MPALQGTQSPPRRHRKPRTQLLVVGPQEGDLGVRPVRLPSPDRPQEARPLASHPHSPPALTPPLAHMEGVTSHPQERATSGGSLLPRQHKMGLLPNVVAAFKGQHLLPQTPQQRSSEQAGMELTEAQDRPDLTTQTGNNEQEENRRCEGRDMRCVIFQEEPVRSGGVMFIREWGREVGLGRVDMDMVPICSMGCGRIE